MCGPSLLGRPRQRSASLLGGRRAAGVCAVEERDAQSPRSAPKKRISHLSAPGARRRHGCRLFFGRGQDSPTRGNQLRPPCPAFVENNFKGIHFFKFAAPSLARAIVAFTSNHTRQSFLFRTRRL